MGEGGRVFACTCGNDLSVREWQRASGQWLCGKTYDGFGPIGPYAVDAESLPTEGSGSPVASTASCASTRIPLT